MSTTRENRASLALLGPPLMDIQVSNGDPDDFLKLIKRSRNRAADRIEVLATLAQAIEAGAARAKR